MSDPAAHRQESEPPADGSPAEALILRAGVPEDGPAVWRLVRETDVLDVNSPYAYTLFLDDFGDTCVIAEEVGVGQDHRASRGGARPTLPPSEDRGGQEVASGPRARREGGTLLGFVLGYRPPRRSHVVFVWQVGVSTAARGRGLGGRMLAALVRSPGCRGVTHLEATVTPTNQASRNLFRAFARRQGAEVTVAPRYTAEHFPKEHSPDEDHEPEELFSIGPFSTMDHDIQDLTP